MGVIARIVLGLAVGLIADKIMHSPHGVVIRTLIGFGGALLGGWVASRVFHVTDLQGFFTISTWVTALGGAVALLAVVALMTGRRGVRSSRGRSLRR